MIFNTNLGGAFSIDDINGLSTSSDLHMAFSDVTDDKAATSVYAFFGDRDFYDMAIRISYPVYAFQKSRPDPSAIFVRS